MLPTPAANCGTRWWQHPDYYSWKSSYASPSLPAGAVVPGAGGAVSAEAAAAASHLAAGAVGAVGAGAGAGAGAGGIPPRGPTFGYHHYHAGGSYGYGNRGFRRGWGRGPSRFVWFSIGAITAGFWYRHHEPRKEEVHRYLSDPGTWRHSLSDHSPSVAPAVTTASVSMSEHSANSPSFPAMMSASSEQMRQTLPDEAKHAGWKTWAQWREERWARKYEAARQRELARSDATHGTAAQDSAASAHGETDSAEIDKIRGSVEKIWEEKKRAAAVAQDKAAAQAREYASDKLDKLSAALDTLRESLRDDAGRARAPEQEQKPDRRESGAAKWV